MDNLNTQEIEQDYDYEVAEWEHIDTVKCPDCGSDKLYQMPRQTSPDDYTMTTECRECGSTWED